MDMDTRHLYIFRISPPKVLLLSTSFTLRSFSIHFSARRHRHFHFQQSHICNSSRIQNIRKKKKMCTKVQSRSKRTTWEMTEREKEREKVTQNEQKNCLHEFSPRCDLFPRLFALFLTFVECVSVDCICSTHRRRRSKKKRRKNTHPTISRVE